MRKATLHSVTVLIMILLATSCNEGEVSSYKNNRTFASTTQNAISADASAGGGNLESASLAILQTKCGGCHGAGASSGGFGIIDDVDAMIASNKYIVPGNPEGSAIYKRIAVAKNMPPAGPLPDSDAATIKQWITGLDLQSQALTILQTKCAKCHGAGANSGGFGIIDDVNAMIASNKYIIPGNPEGSAIYKRIAIAANMPPAGPLPANDANTIKEWIAGLK